MISERNIFNEIPQGVFHSAVFTSFSINMYYWDLQVVKTLNAKGIDNIGILVDDECLSEQLKLYTYQIGNKRPKEYCIHGFRAKGAFHPKIMMFFGQSSALILIGSGNMTTCGHGKNLEVWNPIYVDSVSAPLFPFVREVWYYITSLYGNLGKEAEWFIQSIVDNCVLLKEDYHVQNGFEYHIANYSIRFFPGSPNNNIIGQIEQWVGDDRIEGITIMSPFYDEKARFISHLNELLSPKQIDIIFQDTFGNTPDIKELPKNCLTYSWDDCKIEGANKRVFHAKCMFLQGQKNSYLFCGSANASVAAMGLSAIKNVNYEASVGYKSATRNFFQESGIQLGVTSEMKNANQSEILGSQKKKKCLPVWLKEVSFENDRINFSYTSDNFFPESYINLASGDRKVLFSYKTDIITGEKEVVFTVNELFTPILSWLTNANGEVISNYQFVISSIAMMQNDPSEQNIKFNRSRRSIEQGDIMNKEAIKFFEEVLSESKIMKQLKASKVVDGKLVKEESGAANTFATYEDYKSGNDAQPTLSHNRLSEGHKALSLMDSFISYINRSSQIQEEAEIDDEELENASKSMGKERGESKQKGTNNISQKTFTKNVEKLRNAVKNYLLALENKIELDIHKTTKLPLQLQKKVTIYNELKQYMASTFVLMRLIGYCGRLGDTSDAYKEVRSIFPIEFSKQNRNTITEIFLRITSLFGQHIIQSTSITALNKYEEKKLEYDKKYAFELSIALFSVCQWLNMGNEDFQNILGDYLMIPLLNLKKALGYNVDNLTSICSDVFKRLDQDIQLIDGFDKSQMLFIINETLKKLEDINIAELEDCKPNDCVFMQEIGYANIRSFIKDTSMFIPHTLSGAFHIKKEGFYLDYAIDCKSLNITKLQQSN